MTQYRYKWCFKFQRRAKIQPSIEYSDKALVRYRNKHIIAIFLRVYASKASAFVPMNLSYDAIRYQYKTSMKHRYVYTPKT